MKLMKLDMRVLANNITQRLLAEFTIRGETQEIDEHTLTGIIAEKVEEFFN